MRSSLGVSHKRHLSVILAVSILIGRPSYAAFHFAESAVPKYRVLRIGSEARPNHCAALSVGVPAPILLATGVVNEAFRDLRGWSSEFLGSRLELAKTHWERSRYSVVTDVWGNLEGVIGMTEATYSKESLSAGTFELLPEEETLGVRLPRPLDPHGLGKIVEFRTYFTAEQASPDVRRIVLAETARMLDSAFWTHSELRNHHVVHTYQPTDGSRSPRSRSVYEIFFGFRDLTWDPLPPTAISGRC